MKENSVDMSLNVETISRLDAFIGDAAATLLTDSRDCWQPADFFPEMCSLDAEGELRGLREAARGLPAELIVALVGNMITEEALPSYQTYFNLVRGINPDGVQASEKGWVRWARAWTAEENRHGDLLNRYLFLSGRVQMREVERSIQDLITNGFDPRTEQEPYQAMIYTSFQECATKIAHFNTGKLAEQWGDALLSRICKAIAGDEARHEEAYKRFVSHIFEADPSGAMLAFEKMMRKQIAMPGAMLDKHRGGNLFTRYASVSESLGIYTASSYAEIIDRLVKYWKIETISGLNAMASRSQDYLCNLSQRYRRIAERSKVTESYPLPWVLS